MRKCRLFFKWLTGKTKLSLENLIGHHMSFKVVSIFKIPISSKSDKDENWLVMNGKTKQFMNFLGVNSNSFDKILV